MGSVSIENEFGKLYESREFFSELHPVKFPKPKGVGVQMMPIISSRNFEDSQMPDFLKQYWPMVKRCVESEDDSQIGKVVYLTISESFVKPDETQRRSDIHVDAPKSEEMTNDEGNPGWIYMANSLDDTCQVYDCVLETDADEDIGSHDDVRALLPSPTKLRGNRLYRITDRTPHEALPMMEGVYRQFFRLTTGLSVWYEDQATKNPLGVVSDPTVTKVTVGARKHKIT